MGVWPGVKSNVRRNIGDKAFFGFKMSYLCLHSFLSPLKKTTHGVTETVNLVSRVKMNEQKKYFSSEFCVGKQKI